MKISNLTIIDFNWLRNPELITAERESQLPLRLAFIGLTGCCDRRGCFYWDLHRLKTVIFPFEQLDMSEVLEALRERRFIEKCSLQGRYYGWIPLLQGIKRCPRSFSKH